MTIHRISLWILYILTVAVVVQLFISGVSYYRLSPVERPHSALHADFKPSGLVGHGVGIVGSALMVIMLLYSARKRLRFMQTWGDIRYWLNYHIWMGIAGPLLVILHTSFKLGGIVAVSFWSMVGVALSGVLGRYFYLQVPRSLSGQELSARELFELSKELQQQLREKYAVDESSMAIIQHLAGEHRAVSFWSWVAEDIMLPFRFRSIRKSLREKGEMHGAELHEVMKITRRTIRLRRRMAFLNSAQAILHHWHVIHRPFAVVMLIIMVVHVVITVLFGYRWIFGPGVAIFGS
jgi:hypothetical protein